MIWLELEIWYYPELCKTIGNQRDALVQNVQTHSFLTGNVTPCIFPLAVAYTSDQLLYEWKIKKHPSDGVEYDPTLKLSQFEKHETYIRELAFSRNETST